MAPASGAAWVTGGELPETAQQLSLARYEDEELMAGLAAARSMGVL